jgi:hypothetical protein
LERLWRFSRSVGVTGVPRVGRPGSGCSLRAVTFNVGCPQVGTNACADGIGHALGGGGSASFSARSRASICTGLVAQVRCGPDTRFPVARCLPTASVSLPSLPGKACLLPRPVLGAGEGGREGGRERALLGTGEMDGWRARVMRFARVCLRQCAVVTALAGFWQSRHQIRVLAL